MTPNRKADARLDHAAPKDAASTNDSTSLGGPVGAMHMELTTRLSAADYEAWLLPPEPRDGLERVVHALSLAAGVLALTAVASALWLVL